MSESDVTPELSENMMLVLFTCWRRAHRSEGFPVHGGDVVWEIIRRYRLQEDLAPGSGGIDSRLRGKDLHQYIPEEDRLPIGPRAARRLSESLNEVAWRAQRKGRKAARRADAWASDVQTLVSLAIANANSRGDAVISWHHCMNAVFAVEVLTPREPMASKGHDAPVAVPTPWPWVPFGNLAKLFGVVEWEAPRVVVRAFSGLGRLLRRDIRRFGTVAYMLQRESTRQAVRNGDGMVMPVHVLTAIVSAAYQLNLVGGVVVERFAPLLRAGFSLLDKGIDVDRLRGPATAVSEPRASVYGGKFWQRFPGDPPVGDPAFKLFEEAEAIAARDGRRQISDGDLINAIAASDDPAILSILETVDLDF